MKNIVIHNDRFHADDVFAVATLSLLFGDVNITRTRDERLFESADFVLDVSGIYDREKYFDHHQKEGAGKRDNGIPYASFGLVWNHFGQKLCESLEAHQIVDDKLVQTVDAGDNGCLIYESLEDYSVYGISDMVEAFNPSWKEDADYDTQFIKALEIAKKILEREIKRANDKASAIPLVLEAYEKSSDKRILVLEEFMPFKEVLSEKEEVLYVVSPSKLDDSWRVNAIQSEAFVNKKDLPKEWAGLRDEELQKVSGVSDARFCHRNLFMAVAGSKEGAIKLAELAVNE